MSVQRGNNKFLLEAYSSAQGELLREAIEALRDVTRRLYEGQIATDGEGCKPFPEVQKAYAILYRATGAGL